MIEAILVAMLVFIIWIATTSVGMPVARGRRPVLRSSARPLRFSLRSMLITMTLIAVALGILAAMGRF